MSDTCVTTGVNLAGATAVIQPCAKGYIGKAEKIITRSIELETVFLYKGLPWHKCRRLIK
jgi:hypothetical protein